MQQMMYRLGMAERIHLGTQAGAARGVEDLAQAGARAELLPALEQLPPACSLRLGEGMHGQQQAQAGRRLQPPSRNLCPSPPPPAEAERAEVLGRPPLDFSCTIMVLGLQGTGKTATIHSLLGREAPAGYRETGKVSRGRRGLYRRAEEG